MHESDSTQHYDYYLPSQNVDSEGEKYETDVNSVVLIGANGSGKTRIGEWLERTYPQEVQRISSLRNLALPRKIKLSSQSASVNQMMYGRDEAQLDHSWLYEYDSDISQHRTITSSVSNFEPSIAALVAKENEANRSISREVTHSSQKQLDQATIDKAQSRPEVRIKSLFSSIFPHREIYIHENTIYAIDSRKELTEGTRTQGYNGSELSDGERAALYVIAQVICLPENKIVIVDEPELHLHLSVIKPLWAAIEQERPDCLFIYITHNLEFAEAHRESDKIWVHGYDGQQWQFDRIEESEELPSALEMEIMGSRKPVIFVEGEYSSLDYQLYSLLYPDYQIQPVGDCQQVIDSVRTYRASGHLHYNNVYGIIDHDRRDANQINELKERGIHVLEVAEVENLFLLEDVMRMVLAQPGLGISDVQEVKNYIIDTKFKNRVESLISEQFRDVITNRLHRTSGLKDINTTKEKIQTIINELEDTRASIAEEYHRACQSGNYSDILALLNDKSVAKEIGDKFNLQKSGYIDYVLRCIKSKSEVSGKFRETFLAHLPNFIDDSEVSAALVRK